MIPRLERGPRPTRAPIFGRRRRQCGKRRTALWRKGWKRCGKKRGQWGANGSIISSPEAASTSRISLPPAATGCLQSRMVSRASAVGCDPLRDVPSLRRREVAAALWFDHLLNYMCLPSLEVEEIEFSMWRTSRVVRARHDPPCVPQRAARLAAGLPRRAANCAGSWCCSTRVGLKTSCSTSAGLWRSAWIFPAPTPRAKAG